MKQFYIGLLTESYPNLRIYAFLKVCFWLIFVRLHSVMVYFTTKCFERFRAVSCTFRHKGYLQYVH